MRGQPVHHAFAFGQATVQSRNRNAGKTRSHIRFQLRRQIDFWHQNQDLRRIMFIDAVRENLRGSLQIDFRLATSCHAIQQSRCKSLRAGNRIGSGLLRRIQLRHRERSRIMHRIYLA